MKSDMAGLQEAVRRYLTDDPRDMVPVRTRVPCTVIMIITSTFTALAESAFVSTYAENYHRGLLYFWANLSLFLSFALPWLLLIKRDQHPYQISLITSLLTIVLPIDPLMGLMALTALIARRKRLDKVVPCTVLSLVATLLSLNRDLHMPRKNSLIKSFMSAESEGNLNIPLTCLILSLVFLALAIATGIYIRLNTTTQEATDQASAANARSSELETSLNKQQVADTIAVETHDTLAHSLSLIGLNASALKVELDSLAQQEQTASPDNPLGARLLTLSQRADEIRQQAAGALDETHSVIDMLRHPEQVIRNITPDSQTSLTRQALDNICRESRDTGMTLNTWIDVQDLSSLDPSISKIAYRAVQEGLTNARRHAPDMPVSLEVTARPAQGVHVHLTNPMPRPKDPGQQTRERSNAGGGTGIQGLIRRVKVASGRCAYGVDQYGQFNLDVVLPFIKKS